MNETDELSVRNENWSFVLIYWNYNLVVLIDDTVIIQTENMKFFVLFLCLILSIGFAGASMLDSCSGFDLVQKSSLHQ